MKFGCSLGGWVADVLRNNSDMQSNGTPVSDEDWMRETLRTSMEGCGAASPNPSVGCVLVKDGQEIARGCTQPFGGAHGERVAFLRASDSVNWSEVTAYVALEPCAHHGKQPPCADLFVEKKVGRVVAALRDPFDAVNGQGFERLRKAGIRVDEGVLAKEMALWLSPFLLSVKKKREGKLGLVWAAKWAQSLDGCLADDSGISQWITGPLARQYVQWLRQKYDGILVGVGTLLEDAPRLDARDAHGMPLAPLFQPLRFVSDPGSRLLCAEDEKKVCLRERTFSTGTPLVVVSSRESHDLALTRPGVRAWKHELEALGVVFALFEASSNLEGLLNVMENTDFSSLRPGPFRARPMQSVMVEGGPSLLNALLDARVFDLCHAFLAPFFLGGKRFRLGLPTPLGEAERFVPLASFSAGEDMVWEFSSAQTVEALFSKL